MDGDTPMGKKKTAVSALIQGQRHGLFTHVQSGSPEGLTLAVTLFADCREAISANYGFASAQQGALSPSDGGEDTTSSHFLQAYNACIKEPAPKNRDGSF